MSTPGYIFLCSDATEEECLKRNLFGGKVNYEKKVKPLQVGDRLFLYNYSTKQLHGTFIATSPLHHNPSSTAWHRSGGFPLQVSVERITTHAPVSIEDILYHPTLHGRIKFNAYGWPSARLTPDTVAELEQLFTQRERIVQFDSRARYRADDGHLVRSEAERLIDNWLFAHDVIHIYEPELPEAKRADFGIPLYDKRSKRTGTMLYIEFWGRTDKRYQRDRTFKETKVYQKNKLPLIGIEPSDLKNLDKLLHKKVLGKLGR